MMIIMERNYLHQLFACFHIVFWVVDVFFKHLKQVGFREMISSHA